MSAGREDEATGDASRDVDDERPQSSGGPPTAASVGQQLAPSETDALPLRLLRRVTTQRRTTQLAGTTSSTQRSSPRTGSSAVMRPDPFVDFDDI